MTRKQLKKHWELIKAYKNGAEIQIKAFTEEKWNDIVLPSFSEGAEYRIKPTWEPKNGELIRVSDDGKVWNKRIFVEMVYKNKYRCISGDSTNIVSNSVNTTSWKYARQMEN